MGSHIGNPKAKDEHIK